MGPFKRGSIVTDLNRTPAARPLPVLAIALGLGVLALGGARLLFAAAEPLWFDEAFTLMVVSRPDGATFWREVWLDSNGPIYYTLTHLWTGLFGHGDLALRAPSLLAVWVAGALPIAMAVKGLSREARITWGALIFAWWGVGYFLDARCYALLLAISTLQCLYFARLMDRPDRRAALLWASTAAVAILLHYYAVFFCLAQGVIYLGRHRLKALPTWPAALVFVPVFGWIAYHAPRLAEYSRLGSAWHAPLDAGRALGMAGFVLGPSTPLIPAAVAVILIAGLLLGRTRAGQARDEGDTPAGCLMLTAVSGVLAVAMILVSGLFGSGISPRYLIPAAPPLMLGLVLAARAGGRGRLTYLALVVLYFGVQARPALDALSAPQKQPRYEFETGSQFLMAHGVTDVVFVWDHGIAPIVDRTTLERLGGVFFNRAGHPVRVRPILVDRDHDPNAAILAAAQGPRPGLIWLFDREGHSAASRFPPAIAQRDPRWACAPVEGRVGGLACYRRQDGP
jgi:hypothetical protein